MKNTNPPSLIISCKIISIYTNRLLIIMAVFWLFFPTQIFSSQSASQTDIEKTDSISRALNNCNKKLIVRAKNDRLSIEACQIDIKSLLDEISKQTKIQFQIDPNVQEITTINITDLPIEDGLKKIVENWSMIFEKDPKTRKITLAKVGIYSSSAVKQTTDKDKVIQQNPLTNKTRNVRERYQDIKTAWTNADKDTIVHLLRILEDPYENRPLRIAAARSLAKSGNTDFIDAVKRIIDETEDDNLKYGLTSALGESDSPQSIALLNDIVAGKKNSTLRYKAIQSLMKTGDESEDTLTTLKSAAHKDPDKYSRAKAIIALGKTGNKDFIPFIKEIRAGEKDQFVQHICDTQLNLLDSK